MFLKKISSIVIIDSLFLFLSLSTVSLLAMEVDHRKIVVTGKYGTGGTIVTGKAVVLTKDTPLSVVCKGDILVAFKGHHSWDFGLNMPAGIITEKGDHDSYAVVLAQKLGIPVIVGAKKATKKIDNGNMITLDYSNKTVYAVDNDNSLDGIVKKLQSDKLLIETYVTKTVANQIWMAHKAGKWAAWIVNGLSYYAFDSIPFEFFKSTGAIDDVFTRLEECAPYIQEARVLFKKDTLSDQKKINETELAEFLYQFAVGKMDITDEARTILIKTPIQMDEYVTKGIVNKDEYMLLTLSNFIVRYYLEKEFNK